MVPKYTPMYKYPLKSLTNPPELGCTISGPVASDYSVLEFDQNDGYGFDITPVNGKLEIIMYENIDGKYMRFAFDDMIAALELAKKQFPEFT